VPKEKGRNTCDESEIINQTPGSTSSEELSGVFIIDVVTEACRAKMVRAIYPGLTPASNGVQHDTTRLPEDDKMRECTRADTKADVRVSQSPCRTPCRLSTRVRSS